MKYNPQEAEEEVYEGNDKLDPETNREISTIYRRMNFIVRLYNNAVFRIMTLETENRELKRVQELQGQDIKHITDKLDNIDENTKWTNRAIKQGLIGGFITAVVGFVLFMIQRGFL